MFRQVRVAIGVTILFASVSSAFAADNTASMMTFDDVNGTRYFALSVQPSATLEPASSRDVLILVDTSASQAGAYRDDSIDAVDAILRSLSNDDRIHLAAIDLKAVPMSQGFSAPASEAAKSAVAKLRQRAPLGSTDMIQGLGSASQWFPKDDSKARHIVYIGDGLSHADLPSSEQFSRLVGELAKQKITVTSYAIGPHRNLHLLAALANNTGGQVFVDASNISGQQAGQQLVKAMDSPVIWPRSSELGDAVKESFPNRLPPLRTDRDSIVIGTLQGDANPQQVRMSGEVNGQSIQLNWQVKAEPSSDDYAFLGQLVESARRDGGASLPTIGTAALREIRRLSVANSDQLAQLGGQALASGNLAGAQLLASEALKRDPSNPQASALRRAAEKKGRKTTLLVQDEDEPLQLVPDAVEDLPSNDDAFLQDFARSEAPSGLLDEALEQHRLQEGIIRSEVAQELADMRQMVRNDPNSAIINLKTLRESVSHAPDLDAEVRAELLDRIETSLRQANQQKLEKDLRDQTERTNRAQALERQRLLDLARRDEVLIETYIEQFNSRLDERRYDLAMDAAKAARDVASDLLATNAAVIKGNLASHQAKVSSLRARRWEAIFDTLFQVEDSSLPFPDNPPLIYPDREFWQELTNRRQKYAQIDFAKTGSAEQKILEELDRETKIDFLDEPLSDAINYLETLHGIQIEIDQRALEESGLTTDIPVAKQLSGITLRSALKLMLRDLGLTYVIEDEVLQITTPDEAETRLVTKVYPVADLVLPIQSGIGGGMGGMMGGMGGGMMGGMGGGMMGGMGGMGGGGMMGGMGGMGGGMGGMGMGGMGGFFEVEDVLTLGTAKQDSRPSTFVPQLNKAEQGAHPTAKATLPKGDAGDQAWLNYFQQDSDRIDEAAVRATLRREMTARNFAQVTEILQAGLRAGYVRPWIYEALGLALQAMNAPGDEVERAITSAVDLSNRPEEIMFAAVYLARLGHEERALKLFREIGDAFPNMPEPYIQGLDLAHRLNDTDGISWAVGHILKQAWPKEHRHIQHKAVRIAKATLKDLEKQDATKAKQFRTEVSRAIARDCLVKVSWTGDADIDILVEEPAGTVCSLRNQRTTSGGVLLGDSFANTQSGSDKTMSETYVCPEGFAGRYRMLVRRIWGDVTAGKVTVDVFVNRHTPDERHIRKQIPLSDKDAIVVFEVPEGRRTESLTEHRIASVATTQAAINRAVLAQHLNSVSESDAVADLAVARARARAVGGGFPLFRNPAVGFRPELTVLPEGANMIAATAVISADRRYVRFSPGLLMFSTIGDVQTFNFVTGNAGNGNAGVGGGVGGVGGGVGGGGGGFGGGFGGFGGGF